MSDVTLEDIVAQRNRAAKMMENVRSTMLAPKSKKRAPIFGTSDIKQICNVTDGVMRSTVEKKVLSGGEMIGTRREWSLTQLQDWSREFRKPFLKPAEGDALVVTVANFKGGVAKTTSAVSLAQGLSMRGHKVLFIDLDPQGSASNLFGLIPDSEVESDQTALPLFLGNEETIDSSIQTTYWPGIDLVPASPGLFGAEFALPARQQNDPGFEFWRVLDFGLDNARRTYDVIIIDTPPSLSYVTINAMLAADGVVIPLPPSPLDFASSAQFWDLFSDLTTQLYKNSQKRKTFKFINVLMSRVDANDSAASLVREWIMQTYGDKVLPIEIPKTSVTINASAVFGTVYDVEKGTISPRTFARAKDAYDRYVQLVEEKLVLAWTDQVNEIHKQFEQAQLKRGDE